MNHKTVQSDYWSDVDPAGPQYRLSDIQTMLGISRGKVYNMVNHGELPPLLKIGARASAMPKSWLDAYVRRCAEQALR